MNIYLWSLLWSLFADFSCLSNQRVYLTIAW
jgi:hypothetical protein